MTGHKKCQFVLEFIIWFSYFWHKKLFRNKSKSKKKYMKIWRAQKANIAWNLTCNTYSRFFSLHVLQKEKKNYIVKYEKMTHKRNIQNWSLQMKNEYVCNEWMTFMGVSQPYSDDTNRIRKKKHRINTYIILSSNVHSFLIKIQK